VLQSHDWQSKRTEALLAILLLLCVDINHLAFE